MRFRITELLCVVAVFAFATVSLIRADEAYEMLFVNLTLIFIAVSLVMAIGRTKGSRAFWLGFCTMSVLYLGFAHIPDEYRTSPRHEGFEFTTKLLRLAGEQLHPEAFAFYNENPGPGGFFSVQENPEAIFDVATYQLDDPFRSDPEAGSQNFEGVDFSIRLGSGQTVVDQSNVESIDSYRFMMIGHSAWALLLGWIAGHASRFVYERSRSNV